MEGLETYKGILTLGGARFVEEEFREYSTPAFSGIQRKSIDFSLEEALKERHKRPIENINPFRIAMFQYDDYLIRDVSQEHLGLKIPPRVSNAINMEGVHKYFTQIFPLLKTVGYYEKSGFKNNMLNDEAYHVTRFIPGKRYVDNIQIFDWDVNKDILNSVRIQLEDYRKKGICLMDFAPRDIVLPQIHNSRYIPGLVDTEDVFYGSQPEKSSYTFRKLQAEQFIKDYKIFLKKGYIDEALGFMFNIERKELGKKHS